jgi:hypothetical protein
MLDNTKRLRRSGSHVTIASTEPQPRTGLSGIRTEADNLDGLASRLQFLIVAASIGIILWLVSALCNGGFDKHFEQISSVNRTAAPACSVEKLPRIVARTAESS